MNLSTLELHPFLSCAERLDRPDFVVFDLDAGPPSVRPRRRVAAGAPVADAVDAGSADGLWFGPDDVLDRIAALGDLPTAAPNSA